MEDLIKYSFYKGYILKFKTPDKTNDIFYMRSNNFIQNHKIKFINPNVTFLDFLL